MPVDQDTFRQVLAQWPSGVTVITTRNEAGDPIGITASSFSSVSAEPPLISICVHGKLYTHTAITESGAFAVNILARDQVDMGKRFAGMLPHIEDRFGDLATVDGGTGSPILPEVVAWLDCEVFKAIDAGSHTIFLGSVKDAGLHRSQTPLLYHNRNWGKLGQDLPDTAQIIEVGLRDGLQTQSTIVPTEMKVRAVEQLADAGIRRLQVASFVHPKIVPQMADAEDVIAALPDIEGVEYSGLALNMKGVERANAAGLKHIDVGIAANDALSRRNANISLDESQEAFAAMVTQAQAWDMHVRGGVQVAFGYQSPDDVEFNTVVEIIKGHVALGIEELSIADSSGMANPVAIHNLLAAIRPIIGDIPVLLHLHDTRGMGLANVLAALKSGVNRFDTAFGGLGGCPFIEGAAGNIATEDTAYMMEDMGISTGVDVAAVARVSHDMAAFLGAALPGKLAGLHAPQTESA